MPPVFHIRETDREYRLLTVRVPAGIFEEEAELRRGMIRDTGPERQLAGKPRRAAARLFSARRAVRAQAERAARIGRIVDGLFETLSPYVQDCSARYTVYDESMEEKRLPGDSGSLWRQLWKLPELSGFREEEFVRELLAQHSLPHYLVLGYSPLIPELLWDRAIHMRSLRFVEERQPEGLEEFLEAVNEEYGLAASVEILPEQDISGVRSAFARVRIACPAPAVVLDFSGEGKLLTDRVARGSVWLDMDSLEEKRRRMEERDTGLVYFSTKKLWRQCAMLDTIGKNRYNT